MISNATNRAMGASSTASGYASSAGSASASVATSDAGNVGIEEFRDQLSGQWGTNYYQVTAYTSS